MNPTAYSSRLQGFPTILWFAATGCDIVCFDTRITTVERVPTSRDSNIAQWQSSMKRMSGDVRLKISQGSYMTETRNIMKYCTVNIAIPDIVTVKWQILLSSSWSSIPTLISRTNLASMWSLSCNIQLLTHPQSQHKMQWSMLRKRTVLHFWWVNLANWQSTPHNDIIKPMKARAASQQDWSEP